MPSSYDASYEITYLGPDLAAIVFSISTYGAGAAHPLGSRDSLIFDFAQGRRLGLPDILNSPQGGRAGDLSTLQGGTRSAGGQSGLAIVRRRRLCCNHA